MYKIPKFDGGKPQIYKALLLDIPMKKTEQNTDLKLNMDLFLYRLKIGGLIEIHGNEKVKALAGLKDVSRLYDREMDVVFKIAR